MCWCRDWVRAPCLPLLPSLIPTHHLPIVFPHSSHRTALLNHSSRYGQAVRVARIYTPKSYALTSSYQQPFPSRSPPVQRTPSAKIALAAISPQLVSSPAPQRLPPPTAPPQLNLPVTATPKRERKSYESVDVDILSLLGRPPAQM